VRRRLFLGFAMAPLLGACGGGALEPSGAGAGRIADLWWVMFWLGVVPLVLVIGIIVAAATNRERGRFFTDQRMIVYGGVVLSSLLLIPVVVMTMLVERDLWSDRGDGLNIDIVGHQFWWDVFYPDPAGDGVVRAANEIHIPVGEPVVLRVTSSDVIHSVWIPELHGKIDLIPGRVNELTIHAEQPGVFEGRCAEFCGIGHALMGLVVVATPREEFDDWLWQQSQPASVEVSTATRQTYANSCGPCHTVRGLYDDETFEGVYGPDLTHFASRRTIGASLLPNTDEALARWIVDPQGIKPGNRMPDVGLGAEDLNAIIELLRELR
jgi:cytochrome c oxidase subunit II